MPAPVNIIFGAQTEAAAAQLNAFLSGLQGKLGAIVSAGALLRIAEGMVNATQRAIEMADAMGKMAQKTGIAVESMSRLAYAAEIGDVAAGDLQIALKELSNEMVKAGESSKSVEEKLIEVADEFERLPDGAQKSARAVELFGRSGIAMIPFLNEGRDGIRKLMDQADELGVVVGPKFAKNADEFNDNLTRFKKLGEGAFLRLADQILPDLLDLSSRFLSFLKEMDGKTQAVNNLAFAFKGLANALREMEGGGKFLESLVKGQIQAGQQGVGNALGGSMVNFVMGAAMQGLNSLAPGKSAGNFINAEDSAKLSIGRLDLADADTTAQYQRRELSLAQYLGKRKALVEAAYGVELQAAGNNAVKEEEAAINKQKRLLAIEEEGRKESQRLAKESNQHQIAVLDGKIADTARVGNAAKTGEEKLRLLELESDLLAEKAGLLATIKVDENDTAARDEATAAFAANADAQVQIHKEATDQKLANEAKYYQGTTDMLSNFAQIAKAFGRQGFAVWKGFMIAKATMDTYASAVGAYNSVVGIPYVGPILAPIAAAAAVGAGVANIAQIAAARFATGGLVNGPGTGTSDSIPARLSAGEYVLPAHAVENLGVPFLDNLRAGGSAATAATAAGPSSGGGSSPRFKVGIIRTRQELREFQEEEGLAMFYDDFGRRRADYGLGT